MAFPTATAINQTYAENGLSYISVASGGGYAWIKNELDPYPQYVRESEVGSAYYESNLTGDGIQTSWPINHQLNSDNPMIVVRAPVSGTSFADGQDFDTKQATITLSNLNNLTAVINPPIPDGETWRISVIGLDLLDGLFSGGGNNYITLDNLDTAYYNVEIAGNGSNDTFTITHNLDSGHIIVEVRAPASGSSFTKGQDYETKNAMVTISGVNTCSVVTDEPIPSGEVWHFSVLGVDKLDGIVGGGGGGLGGSETVTTLVVNSPGNFTYTNEDDVDVTVTYEPAGAANTAAATAVTTAGTNATTAIATHNGLINAHLMAPVTVNPSAGVLSYSLVASKVFVSTLTANISAININNILPSNVDYCRIIMKYSGAIRTVAWPAWYWVGGVAAQPPQNASEHLVIDLLTYDGGTTVYASYAPMKQV